MRPSFDELRVRGAQALHVRVERLLDHLSHFRQQLSPTCPATTLLFEGGVAPLSGASEEPQTIARAIARLDPETHGRLAEQSDAAERGMVKLLGYEPVSVGNPPRWHREPISGIEAPRCHWSRIDYLDTAVVGDHKLLWELNRHQYLLAPAFCWLLDREARRFELIQSHLTSWLNDNPPRTGVNWASSLELAYRAIAWGWLLWMLRDAPWRPELQGRLAMSVQAHALQIERYLSTYFSPNTHLTGEALGLFYIGTWLSRSPHSHRWRAKGAGILESAITRQVTADGVYFEMASQYHRYTAEIYLRYLLLAGATGWPVPATVRERLAKLFVVMRSVASAGGLIPLLGDDDGGLLLPQDARAPDDARALLLAAAVALRRPELTLSVESPPSYAYWLCGIEETDRFRDRSIERPHWSDIYFANGGLAVLRDGWESTAAVSVIDAGPHGALSYGHSHADALAMTLALGPTEFFIDRGTLTYTGPERDEFRETGSHNTLEIDGTSAVFPAGPFKWQRGIPARAEGVVFSSSEFSSFFGLAMGHVTGGRTSAHCRRVLHQKGGAWIVHDRGLREATRGGVVRWQLGPQLTATALTPQSVTVRDRTGAGVATVWLRGAAGIRIVTREVSLRLGDRTPAQCLELGVDSSLEALTIIVPARRDGSLVSLSVDMQRDEPHIVWSDDAGEHRLIAGVHQYLEAANLDHRVDLLWRTDCWGADNIGRVLLVAMPTVLLRVPADAGAVTDVLEQSGRMIALENRDGRWMPLNVVQPRSS